MGLVEQAYLTNWEAGAQWSSALGNQMCIDGLCDKIIKGPRSLRGIYIHLVMKFLVSKLSKCVNYFLYEEGIQLLSSKKTLTKLTELCEVSLTIWKK